MLAEMVHTDCGSAVGFNHSRYALSSRAGIPPKRPLSNAVSLLVSVEANRASWTENKAPKLCHGNSVVKQCSGMMW